MPAGYLGPSVAARPAQTNPALAFSPNTTLAGSPTPTSTALQNPGNNMVNPGYGEQAFTQTQNRLLEDPYAQTTQNLVGQASKPSAGQNYLNANLGTLNGPGQGEQYWNQVSGQFQDPFAGEQYARQATQNMSPTGPAGAFYNQAMGQYGDFTGYSGPQNTQGQYGQSQGQIGNAAQGENMLGQLSQQYGNIGQYNDPNLAAGQYAQTQGAFGDMPIANFDPFYDRASQLGVQKYNQQASGRGVYGSSEALSGVGNVITDIEAQRANRSFDAEMQRAQEQRMRQQLLGEQARMGDLSSLSAFGANLSGAETFGNLANMQASQTVNRNQVLGNMANQADTQALGAQNANIAGVNAFGNLAGQADTAETNRFTASTNAMNNADRTAIDRLRAGSDIANSADDSRRADYTASTNAATQAGNLDNSRLQTASGIANSGSANDLARLNSYNNTAQGAEGQRQNRVQSEIDSVTSMSKDVANLVASAQKDMFGASQADFENYVTTQLAPALQAAGLSQAEQDKFISALQQGWGIVARKATE